MSDPAIAKLEALEKQLAGMQAQLDRIEASQGALPVGLKLRDAQWLLVSRTLRACEGHITNTAKVLGLTRTGLQQMLRRWREEGNDVLQD